MMSACERCRAYEELDCSEGVLTRAAGPDLVNAVDTVLYHGTLKDTTAHQFRAYRVEKCLVSSDYDIVTVEWNLVSERHVDRKNAVHGPGERCRQSSTVALRRDGCYTDVSRGLCCIGDCRYRDEHR